MSLVICLAALAALIFFAYRGYSVILLAPVLAMLAVLFTEPSSVAPAYSGLFMKKAATFVQNYFPVFLLGAIFGKLVEASGAARTIVQAITRLLGPQQAILAITLVGMILTYGGVSVFVVVFAVYPFAAEMFRSADIPKRLIPATIALAALTGTLDALPGTPQIANIIPTTFFKTDGFAAPVLGIAGSLFSFCLGWAYLEWERRKARVAGEGYGVDHIKEPEVVDASEGPKLWLSLLPLIVVGFGNRLALTLIQTYYGADAAVLLGGAGTGSPVVEDVKANAGIWAVEAALVAGILVAIAIAWRRILPRLADLTHVAVGGALLAGLNTASEYGFGAIIAALPGFRIIGEALSGIRNPLLNVAVITNVLSGMTGSSSGGLSLTLGAFSEKFIALANGEGIPLEAVHRISAMASGGMDTLPHNGMIVTLLLVCGLTHRQAYMPILGITAIKTGAVFFAVALYSFTGLV
ncbi:MAG TPA: GntP family permease [Novosphingobium sp.]|nr:GntP family permease [Novosphingobium sp.]